MKENMYSKIAVILMAAGKSIRFSKETKQLKQFYLLNDKPIYRYSFDFFVSYGFSKILLVLPEDYLKNFEEKNKKITYISGGNLRSESVYNAILHLKYNKIQVSHCIIHDVARPFIDKNILNNIMSEIYNYPSITCALNISDTIGYGKDYIEKYIDRNFTYLIQTPQAFSFDILEDCYEKYMNEKDKKIFTDDTSLVYEYAKIKPKIIMGSKNLFKITNFEDLEYAKFLLEKNRINQ
jgi:2-C-methyl-D-erythritol 4-phosphate cytidylyltransferase